MESSVVLSGRAEERNGSMLQADMRNVTQDCVVGRWWLKWDEVGNVNTV